MPELVPTVLDHDGSVDDLMALLLLLALDHVDLRAVVVTEGDCYIEPAVSATRSILRLAGRADVPIGQSAARPVNPMPAEWRVTSWVVDNLPILKATHNGRVTDVLGGEQLMTEVLRSADRPVTIVVTGPLSCLASVLQRAPELGEKVGRLLWMGGALRVAGNVSPFTELSHDGSAEWNAYWDPPAVEAVWRTDVALTICPLDATDRSGLEPRDLATGLVDLRDRRFGDLAGQAYALVSHLRDYYLWDVTTVGYLAWPSIYEIERLATRVHVSGPSEGRIEIVPDGRAAEVITSVDAGALRTRLLEHWARD